MCMCIILFNELTHFNFAVTRPIATSLTTYRVPDLVFKVYMLCCKIYTIERSNQDFLTHLSHLPRGIV